MAFLLCLHCCVSCQQFLPNSAPDDTNFCPSLVIECLVIYFFFVETMGPTLEEIAVLFDGKDSAAGIAQAQAQEKVMSTTKEVEHA